MGKIAALREFMSARFRWLGFALSLAMGFGQGSSHNWHRKGAEDPHNSQVGPVDADESVTGTNPGTGLPMISPTLDVAGKHWGES